jgi:peptidoglycan/LPS O-acetylase OafA/YrhL
MIATRQPDTPAESARRISELDGVRGAAALAIVAWHYIPSIANAVPGTPLAYVSRACSLTWAGVDLFFVLSGYLIASNLIRAIDSPRFFTTFYARRAARILPLYWLILTGLLLGHLAGQGTTGAKFQPVFDNNLPWWSYLAFVQNFFMVQVNNLGPIFTIVAWSLAVEEQFYLLLPVLIWSVRGPRLGWLLLSLAFIAPLLRATVPAPLASYVLLPFRMDSLMLGAFLGLVHSLPAWRPHVPGRIWLATFWCALALPAPFVIRSGAGLYALTGPMGWLLHSWLALWFAVTLAWLLAGAEWLGSFFRLRALQAVGRFAYSLYLLHMPVLWILHLSILGTAPILKDRQTIAVTALAAIVSLALAPLSYRWIEEPFLAWGKRFRY